jgi:hypothetical protein
MRLRRAEKAVLHALISGQRLRSQRDLDGDKRYALYALDATPPQPVAHAVVERLAALGLIESNHKFPAATYLLTVKGEQVAAALTAAPLRPLISRLRPR